MGTNPVFGILFHWIGGLAAASFYIPYRYVRGWAWETYWLVGGVFSWLLAPWLFAWFLVPNFGELLLSAPKASLLWTYLFGVLWGMGGLTFGLTMRYLGIALGMAIALGYCAVFGTLMPPIFSGEIGEVFRSSSGQVILVGVAACILGIAISGMAGMSKERELPEEQKRAAVKEFNFLKGLLVATFSGIMSSCFAYGLAAGKPLADLSREMLLANGKSDLWQNLPVLIVVLLGGFTTNFLWCLMLNLRNGTGREYIEGNSQKTTSDVNGTPKCTPLYINYILCAAAGVTWYLQFFFYGMGATRMGPYEFSSWTMHMASIIIFSTLWGIALREWKGTSRRTHLLIAAGLLVLILSTIIVGYGNYLKGGPLVH